MKIEAIPGIAAPIYTLVAKKSPFIKDIYAEVVNDVCSEISSGKVLDVGTGPGYLPIAIAKKSSGLKITGVDLSPKMVEIAGRNAAEQGVADRVDFKIANAGSLPFENESFDMIVSTMSLHHWKDPKSYIRELHRVLKKNGRLAIYDIWRDTPKEVDAEIKKRYGWFLAFLLLVVVRAHSSITRKTAEDLLASLDVNFSSKSVDTRGVTVILRMEK